MLKFLWEQVFNCFSVDSYQGVLEIFSVWKFNSLNTTKGLRKWFSTQVLRNRNGSINSCLNSLKYDINCASSVLKKYHWMKTF